MRKYLVLIVLISWSCRSGKHSQSKMNELAIKEAWFNEQIGGTKEAGITREYNIFTANWPKHASADSICSQEFCVDLRRIGDQHYTAVYQFQPGQNQFVDQGVLLKLTIDGEPHHIRLDSIYLKERVILP